MKVLIQGSNGFIGSNLTAQLMEQGYEAKCLVRKSSNLDLLKQFTDINHLTLCYGDINDSASLDEHLRDVDIVYHVAGAVKALTQRDYDKVNLYGTKNILDSLLRVNPHVKRVVFISSIAANGPSNTGVFATEDMEPNPIFAYGLSKYKAEKLIMENYMSQLPITVIRPPIVFGPGDKVTLTLFQQVAKGIKLYQRGPDRYYSIVYISDLINGIILAGEKKEAISETFYICGDGAETWQGLQDIIAETLGTKIQFTFKISKSVMLTFAYMAETLGKISKTTPFLNKGKVKEAFAPGWTFSNEKAKKLLGFSPMVNIKECMEKTAFWFTKNGWL